MIPLARATAYANKIAAELAPFCLLPPMVTGSTRRLQRQVGDIDIVVIPSDQVALAARAKRQAVRVTMDGAQRFSAIYPGDVQLDLFYAHQGLKDLFDPQPSNIGAVTLYSTGSKDHNIFLCRMAERNGMSFDPWRGLMRDGRVVAGESELRIYSALQLPFVDPPDRETFATIQAAVLRWAHAEMCKSITAAPASTHEDAALPL